MSTCPRCKRHLTDSHRCPRGRVRVAAELIVAAVVGGLTGLLIVSFIDPQGRAILDAAWLGGGALAGVGLDRRRRR